MSSEHGCISKAYSVLRIFKSSCRKKRSNFCGSIRFGLRSWQTHNLFPESVWRFELLLLAVCCIQLIVFSIESFANSFFMQNFKETMRKTRKKPNVVECCSSEKILSMFQVSYWDVSIRYSSVFYSCFRKQTKPLKRFRKALKIISKPSEWAFQGLKHFESRGIILECTGYPVWYSFLSGSTFFPMTSCLKSFLKLEIHVPCRSNFNRYTRLARVYWSKFINFPLLAFIPRNIFMRDINSFQLIHLSWTMHSRISGNVLMQWPQPILKMDRRWRENTYQPLSLQPWIVQKRRRLLSEALSVVNYAD